MNFCGPQNGSGKRAHFLAHITTNARKSIKWHRIRARLADPKTGPHNVRFGAIFCKQRFRFFSDAPCLLSCPTAPPSPSLVVQKAAARTPQMGPENEPTSGPQFGSRRRSSCNCSFRFARGQNQARNLDPFSGPRKTCFLPLAIRRPCGREASHVTSATLILSICVSAKAIVT